MGKKATNEEKFSLMEFLYKDEILISSLYSQVFGGDLDEVSQNSSSINKTLRGKNGSIKVATLNKSSEKSSSDELSKKIKPRDAKILDLVSELNIKEYDKSLTRCKNGRLIRLEGDLFFRNFDRLKNMFPLLPKMDIFNNIKLPISNNDEDFQLILNYISDFMPVGIELEILTKQHEQMICNINKDFLMISLDNISKIYNGNYLGNWTIIGVFDNNDSKKMPALNTGAIRKSIDDVENIAVKSFFNDEKTSFVLKPILIYRTISY